MRKIKLSDVFVPKYRVYLIIILVLLIILSIFKPILIPLYIIVFIGVLFVTYRTNYLKKERIIKHINSFMIKLNTDESILNFPIPSTIVTNDGEILWSNDGFDSLFKGINNSSSIKSFCKTSS